MKEYLVKLYQSPAGWFCIKLFFSLFWLDEINYMLWTLNGFMLPVGICKLISCSVFGITSIKIAVLAILFPTLYFYLKSEKYAIPSLSILLLFSIWIISAHESTGIFLRANLFSMAWAGQLLAYIIHKNELPNLYKYRHQYVVQLITATYFLAAFSKLLDAGWDWPAQGKEFLPLSVLKAYYFDYFDTGNATFLTTGLDWANELIANKQFVFLLLYFTLLIELFSPLANLDSRLTFLVGLLLFLMHRGIDYSMNIIISGTYYTMIAFMLNPFGIIYLLYKRNAEKL